MTDEDCDFTIKRSVSRNTMSLVLDVDVLPDEGESRFDVLIVAVTTVSKDRESLWVERQTPIHVQICTQ